MIAIRAAIAVFCALNIAAVVKLGRVPEGVPLRTAVEQNPRFSGGWIRLGLESERAEKMEQAEEELLRAARIDRRFLPAWTLANFYFRRDNRSEFWKWAHRAAALTYDDYRPLLRLCDAI